jgi:hypothetical protein
MTFRQNVGVKPAIFDRVGKSLHASRAFNEITCIYSDILSENTCAHPCAFNEITCIYSDILSENTCAHPCARAEAAKYIVWAQVLRMVLS